jgi:ABC-type thiamine transport system substrate-binding protein
MKMKRSLLVCLLCVAVLLVGCESAQQKAYDLKADTVGTHRIVEVYTEAGDKIATIEDKSMRFELVGERSVRLWLGDKNEKVMIGNMGFIIRDQ